MVGGIETPEELANHLAYLQLGCGELESGDLRLARAIYCTYNGALITWAVLREGTLARWPDRELDFLLAPRS